MSEYGAGSGDAAGGESGDEAWDEAGHGIEREYRRRWVPGRLLAQYAFLTLNCVLQLTRMSTGEVADWVRPVLAVTMVLAVGRLALYMGRGRTLVTDDGIHVRRAVSGRRRAWRDIYDIRVEPIPRKSWLAPQWVTFLYDTEGRRFLLPHVDDWQLADPHAEMTDLRYAATRQRGTTWERRPAVEALIRRRAGHRTAWQRAFNGGLIVWLCMFVLWVVLLVTQDEQPTLLLLAWIPLAAFALLAALLNWRWESQVPRSLREP
ncbi:PH domain-containing protein [Streptomyces sp. NBC_01615]|uniref:PH domain-containing protein n=1 Tax=Streptomyces sp. NBC_01615 TaxID=2975898 RepID=UPI00386CBE82